MIASREEKQLSLMEIPPLEAAAENVLEILSKQVGVPTVNSWLKPLRFVKIEDLDMHITQVAASCCGFTFFPPCRVRYG